jgi:hypothetical protein
VRLALFIFEHWLVERVRRKPVLIISRDVEAA